MHIYILLYNFRLSSRDSSLYQTSRPRDINLWSQKQIFDENDAATEPQGIYNKTFSPAFRFRYLSCTLHQMLDNAKGKEEPS